jgi:hypothetical protein
MYVTIKYFSRALEMSHISRPINNEAFDFNSFKYCYVLANV